jgi:uncharacterized membrane protein
MEQNNNEEIDLGFLFNLLRKTANKFISLVFDALSFIQKKIIIILILLIIGVVFGYFSNHNEEPDLKVEVLVRVNFDAVNYVYNEVDLIRNKISEKDSLFFSKIGLIDGVNQILDVEITPVVDLTEIIDNLSANSRYLESIIKNIEFDKSELELSESLNTEYNDHILHIKLSSNGNKSVVKNILIYLNDNEIFNNLKKVSVKNLEETIEGNKFLMKQIDHILDSYNNEAVSSINNQVYIVDKTINLDELVQKKINLMAGNISLTESLVLSRETVVLLSHLNVLKVEQDSLNNTIIQYPAILVGLFLFLALTRRAYFSLKKISQIND